MTDSLDEKKEITSLDDEGDTGAVIISLVSKEGRKYPVSKKAVMLSELIKTTLEGDPTETEVQLVNIEGSIIAKVIEYMNYHEKVKPRRIEKPLVSTNMNELVDRFDANFVNVDQETMFKLLLAANYMNIKPLLHLVCAKAASLMKGKTPDQIRATFNIRNDYTPAEEEEVRKEHKDLIG